MTLIKCTECGHEISDKAKSCPNCGFPIEEQKVKKEKSSNKEKKEQKKFEDTDEEEKNSSGKIIVIIIAIFLVIFMIKSVAKSAKNNGTTRDRSVPQIEIIVNKTPIMEEKSINSKVIGQVYSGEIYNIINEDSTSIYNWIEIETKNGIRGFITGSYDGNTYIEKLETTSTELTDKRSAKEKLIDYFKELEAYDEKDIMNVNCTTNTCTISSKNSRDDIIDFTNKIYYSSSSNNNDRTYYEYNFHKVTGYAKLTTQKITIEVNVVFNETENTYTYSWNSSVRGVDVSDIAKSTAKIIADYYSLFEEDCNNAKINKKDL